MTDLITRKSNQSLEMYRQMRAIKEALPNATKEQMASALLYVLTIIESYNIEIREPYNGHDLFEEGFCQGSIFTEVFSDILKKLRAPDIAHIKLRPQIDNMDKICRDCGGGRYMETSVFDDSDGVLHCTNCGIQVSRWMDV